MQVGRLECVGAGEQDGALEDVAQLADVAGPRIGLERAHRLLAQRDGPAAAIAPEPPQQLGGQRGDVFPALAQRRDAEHQGADAEIEITAELLLVRETAQIMRRRRDEAQIDRPILDVSEPAEALVLEHGEQLRLDERIDVADLVQEDGAAMRHLEQPEFVRERALGVAEQLGFEQLPRQTGAVQVHKRLAGARRMPVEPARHHALSRSGFPQDEHRTVGAGHLRRLFAEAPHRGPPPAALERIDLAAPVAARLVGKLAAMRPLALQHALQQDQQRRQLDRFDQEVVRALFDGAHRELDRPLSGQDDHRQVRLDGFQSRQQVQRVAVGQAVVEHDGVGPRVPDRALRGGAGIGFHDLVILQLEEIVYGEADALLVVDDEDLALRHEPAPTP